MIPDDEPGDFNERKERDQMPERLLDIGGRYRYIDGNGLVDMDVELIGLDPASHYGAFVNIKLSNGKMISVPPERLSE